MQALGVDCVIDVSGTDQVDAVASCTAGRGVDVIIDSVGGTVFEANLKSLAVQGRLVNIGRLGSSSATIDLNALWLKRLKLIGVTFRTRTEEERLACVQACAPRPARAASQPAHCARSVDRTSGSTRSRRPTTT